MLCRLQGQAAWLCRGHKTHQIASLKFLQMKRRGQNKGEFMAEPNFYSFCQQNLPFQYCTDHRGEWHWCSINSRSHQKPTEPSLLRQIRQTRRHQFYQCVRLARLENDRTISFIPPDGEFDLRPIDWTRTSNRSWGRGGAPQGGQDHMIDQDKESIQIQERGQQCWGRPSSDW